MRCFVFLCIFISFSAKAQLRWLHPQPNGNTLNGIAFITAKTVIAVGNAGTILLSEDSGKTWKNKVSGIYEDLLAVHFVNEKTGYISGSAGLFLCSNDGGKSWVKKATNTKWWLYCMQWLDSMHGFLGGDRGTLLFTTDGGNTWNPQVSGFGVNAIMSVYFRDSIHGYIAGGYGNYAITANKGQIWANYTLPKKAWNTGIYFADANTGYISARFGNGTFFKTINGGNNWNDYSQKTDNTLNGLFALDASHIWGVGQMCQIFNAINNGTKLNSQTAFNSNIFYAINFYDTLHGIAVGDNGIIYRKEWGLVWNVGLETGGWLVSDEVKIHAEIQVLKQA